MNKKIILVSALVFASFGVAAEPTESRGFEQRTLGADHGYSNNNRLEAHNRAEGHRQNVAPDATESPDEDLVDFTDTTEAGPE